MNNKRIFKNAAWIVGCKIFQALLGLVVTMLSARYLGPSGYGLINYAASIVAFVVPVMQLGLNSTLVQEIVNDPDREGEILGTSIAMNLVSSVFCILGIVFFSAIANRGETVTTAVCALYSIQLVFQSLELIQCWFQAKLLSRYTAITMLVAYGVTAAYKILLLILGSSVYWFAVAQALDFGIIGVTLLIIYRKVGTARLSFSWQLARQLFSRSKYYIVSSLMVTVFAQTDRIMLKAMVDEAAVGYYSAAISCATMTGFVFVAIIDSARPGIFESARASASSFEKSVSALYCVIIWLSLVQCAGITFFAELIVSILYGSAYAPTVGTLRLVVWYTTFSYLGAVRNIWILAEGKQKYLWIINLSGAGANVILNALMIPVWGINGAALASLITQIFTNVIISFLLKPIRPNAMLMLRGLDLRQLLPFITKRDSEL
ncbi:MAG: flippase [Oscillospiraceae bacterium]|nr:flippase [Oscillospiraceae bacterium]